MRQRGRKSGEALATTPVLLEAKRPPPPADLTQAEAEVWRDTVGTMPTGWFSRAQYPVLMSYCRHTARAAQLAGMVNQFQPEWIGEDGGLQRLDKLLAMAERETRALTACARSMRLTHQAQIQPRGAARAIENGVPEERARPWEW